MQEEADPDYKGRKGKRLGTLEPDAQGLSMQYVANDQSIQKHLGELQLVREESVLKVF